jgi:hypothetical protein
MLEFRQPCMIRILEAPVDMAQDGASELGEEALDEVEPGAVLGREGALALEAARARQRKSKHALWLVSSFLTVLWIVATLSYWL